MIAVAWMFDLKLSWIGKHTLFDGKAGGFMRWLGGIPVDRRARHGAVAQVVDHIDGSDSIMLAIAPAGTRAYRDSWKSGFYHMAAGSQVPIICGFLDFDRKVGGVGPSFIPSGDLKADMDRVRGFYENVGGLYPDMVSAIRLRDEDDVEVVSGVKPSVAAPAKVARLVMASAG